ncbi:MAG: hypothetical protein VKL39_04605 [Leptolyngbyaceae bacterium]|nr:hypothetical protein [Leptolyngbyaceae bacterium]
MYDFALCIWLLTSTDHHEADLATLRAMNHVCIVLELADPRESIFTTPTSWKCDLETARSRYRQLHGQPALALANALPDRDTIQAIIEANRREHARLRQLADLELDRAPAFHAAMADLNWRYQVWDAARDARCEHYWTATRRFALARLNQLVEGGALPEGFASR